MLGSLRLLPFQLHKNLVCVAKIFHPLDQGCGAVVKITQLRRYSFHEHGPAPAPELLVFMSVVPAPEPFFYMAPTPAPAPASVRFHTLIF